MCKLVKKIWYSISLQQKLLAFASIVTVVLVVSSFFNFKLVEFSIDGFSDILNDNARCGAFLEAMEGERDAFQTMMREGTGESRHAYEKAIQETKKSVLALPYSYQTIGSRRYARTWSIKNAYETYSILRDQLVSMGTSDPDYVERLYWIYDIQDYLVLYGNRLIQETLNQGNVSYQEKAGRFSALPYGLLIVSGIMLGAILWLTKVLSDTMVDPVLKLSESSARIESGDFSEEDVEIKNQDEMGQLVRNFNRMKHAMEEHIHTLQEKNEMSSRLHREEVERIETEKRLEAARMELLKSQINPHFLFNTLSMIACMAKLEEAETTEKMITSMSSLFRYNLKTSEQIVALKQELDVVQNYIYIQKMRFGSRVAYETDIRTDAGRIRIPAFTMQPIVENAIIHGFSKKEAGGRIIVRAWERENQVVISVADNGLGMDSQRLRELRDGLKGGKTAKVGIGLGNISKRIHNMYQRGNVQIYSTEGRGTVIQMVIPQDEEPKMW